MILRALTGRRADPLTRMRRRELEIDGECARVHLLPAPDGKDGAAFVLVHGLGVSSRWFVDLAEKLSKFGGVVLVDLPGFAGLPNPSEPMDIPDFAGVVVGIVDSLDMPDAVLIGHSMGAQVVTEALRTRPDLFRAGLLISPVLHQGRLPTVLARFLRTARHETLHNAFTALRGYALCGPQWFWGTLPAIMRYPIVERLSEVRVPVSIIGGELDRVSPSWWRHQLAESIDAPSLTLPDSAHGVVFEHAERIVEEAVALSHRAEDAGR